jgi:hypothetical protein
MDTKELLKNNLSDLCDVLTFQNLSGGYELGVMNIKEQNERYRATIEEILDSNATCATLLIHSLDQELDRVAVGGIAFKDLDKLHCAVYSLQQIKEINEQINGGDDYDF